MAKKDTRSTIIDPPRIAEQAGMGPLQMGFPKAMHELMRGRRVTRVGWENPSVYVEIVDEYLMIHKANGDLNALILRVSDIFAEDWIVQPHEN